MRPQNPPKIGADFEEPFRIPNVDESNGDKMMPLSNESDEKGNKKTKRARDPREQKKRQKRKQKESLARQTEKAVLSCQVWVKQIQPAEAHERMMAKFPKVPLPCLTGIIAALYPKETKSFSQREESGRGQPEHQVVGSSPFNVPMESEGQPRQSEAAAHDPSVELN